MQCLAMAVIASFIGATGLGWNLLRSLNQLRIGLALECGVCIVLIAVVLDKISLAWANKQTDYFADLTFIQRYKFSLLFLVILLAGSLLAYIGTFFFKEGFNYLYIVPHNKGFTTENFWMDGSLGYHCRIFKQCNPKDIRISKFNAELSAVGTYGESRVGVDNFVAGSLTHASPTMGAGDMAIDSLDNIYALIRNKNWDDENDLSTARIDKYTSSGVLIASIPLSNDKKSRQIGGDPRAIDVDSAGNILSLIHI